MKLDACLLVCWKLRAGPAGFRGLACRTDDVRGGGLHIPSSAQPRDLGPLWSWPEAFPAIDSRRMDSQHKLSAL